MMLLLCHSLSLHRFLQQLQLRNGINLKRCNLQQKFLIFLSCFSGNDWKQFFVYTLTDFYLQQVVILYLLADRDKSQKQITNRKGQAPNKFQIEETKIKMILCIFEFLIYNFFDSWFLVLNFFFADLIKKLLCAG